MHAPLFWKDTNRISNALLPFASVYGWLAARRARGCVPQELPVPVLCIGNLVAGGAGKTPVALAIGAMLKEQGVEAHFLSRGYKGKLAGPMQVDASRHTAAEVGDEPLLLAAVLPTWVARDRAAGAQAAIVAGAKYIIMDDGFQNPVLHKDISLLVIDGAYGFGNERLLLAGPLREPIADAMARAQAVLLIGEDVHHALRHVPDYKPVLRARLMPTVAAQAIAGRQVVAFAGIARPHKFYHTLHQQLGCTVRKMVAYPDHHVYRASELAYLSDKAKELEATLVTTSKDYVRLPPYMRAQVVSVPVEVVFDAPDSVRKLVSHAA